MEPAQTWVSEPDRLLHILASCAVFYAYIILLTRLSGKRTTGNMNNFDWIITVGIGSLMASGILLRNVSMLDAMLAVAALTGLQWLTTWGALRSPRFARWVKPRPRLLWTDGRPLDAALRRERITDDEVESAMRQAGLARGDAAGWVVLETSGQLSVIPAGGASGPADADLLHPVAGSARDQGGETDDRGGT
ncbi:DUF421 domain-containing protein [Poseidonocella sedimentorum]|uniref:Uncharacterized membrane protein YcaP, DUF421 family n=1 Tax=Poseidonocella sedimentorum TaxID=871652 RepID=A0A1I6CVZ5_9RHOB|nr:YetF domain-containing protein [Poseidonocella sedimentorum]SFQ97247.1 Uncharacterized membrane protein YcaP, DUF421 family [Poseidonocella sedimentorum]